LNPANIFRTKATKMAPKLAARAGTALAGPAGTGAVVAASPS